MTPVSVTNLSTRCTSWDTLRRLTTPGKVTFVPSSTQSEGGGGRTCKVDGLSKKKVKLSEAYRAERCSGSHTV
jgi:hypothetical protein